jgi:DnaB-like helicase C terminal domain/Toprim-like
MEVYELPCIVADQPLIPPLLHVPLVSGIPSRGLTYETTLLYRTYAGTRPLEVFHEYFDLDTGDLCGIKFRKGGWTAGKKDTKWSPGSKRSLFGSHLYEGVTTPVYLFEGETDAMAMSQHVGSDGLCLAYGGKPSPQLLDTWIQWILKVSGGEVYLCFDADQDGEAYTQEFLKRWPNDDAKRIVLPPLTKDVAQLLMEGGNIEFEHLQYTLPDCILTGADLVATESHAGQDYLTTGFKDLDHYIGGYAPGKLIALVGPTKSGKTTFVSALTVNYMALHPGKVLYIPLELSYDQTMQVLASLRAGVHISEITEEQLEVERKVIAERMMMVKHYGFMPIEILEMILDVIPRSGVKLVVLDHITAAATSFTEGLTTNLLDAMMSLLTSKLSEYKVAGLVVTHINGSGGDLLHLGAIRGSQSIGQLSSSVLGIRRLESGLTEVYTMAPDRFTGRMGRVTFEFDGKFKPLNRKSSDL